MKWCAKNSIPKYSGWYYVREAQPRMMIGIRYFLSDDKSWHCVSHRQIVPNNTFFEWLNIAGVTERQRP